jgi:S1-C subfamily serine protease
MVMEETRSPEPAQPPPDEPARGDQPSAGLAEEEREKPGQAEAPREKPAAATAEQDKPQPGGPDPVMAGSGPAPATRRQKRQRLGVAAAAAVILLGTGFGGFAAGGGLSRSVSSAIPAPPRANSMFVEDDDGTGQDNQENILEQTAPGLLHVTAAGRAAAAVGVVLTPSGLVLTASRALPAAGRLTVRTVLGGRAYAARRVGTDAGSGLTLLQVEKAPALRPVAIGSSADFAVGDAVTAVGSAGTSRTLTLDLGNLADRAATADLGGRTIRGLFAATLQVPPGNAIGGPLVNLSGQVVGIDLAGAGTGLHSVGFAVPINAALSIARHIDRR